MEARLFEADEVPPWTTPEWYTGREAAPHLEQEGHRERLQLAADMIRDAFVGGANQIVDLGAGDGGLLSVFINDPSLSVRQDVGYDLQQSNVDAAALRGVRVHLQDVVADFPPVDPSDVLVACEILEHLVDPHGFVSRMFDSPARWAVFSSPYTETAEAHYDFHTWAWDMEGYRAMIEGAGWRVARHETAWICSVVLATKP